jgi:heme/copper-type cytochrome/quinol oxidase subunit 2
MNTIFDLYQTVSNISINNETISKRNISSHDIVIIIIFSLICLMIFICVIITFVQRYRKRKERNDLRFSKDSISKKIQVKKQIIETPNQSDSIQ